MKISGKKILLIIGLQRARMMDDVSSDSAVSSMGSSPQHNVCTHRFGYFNNFNSIVASLACVKDVKLKFPHLQDFDETGSMMSNISSPFDGLEGATGGSDYDSGSDKYNPKLLRYVLKLYILTYVV